MLYKERTLDEWNALRSEQQISIERGYGTGFGFVADEQARLDARLGAKVRDRMTIHCFTPGSLRSMAGDLSNVGYDGASAFLREIADALAAEEAGDG